MRPTADRCLDWAPRIVAFAFAAVLPAAGLREFQRGPRDAETIIALVMHMLLTGAILGLVYCAW